MDTLKEDSISRYLYPRKIRMFMCYSQDVADDVNAFRLAMADLNRLFPDTFNVEVEHWEDNPMLDIHHNKSKIQDVFDGKILKSDYVIFLFHNTFGEYTMHEWKLCSKNKNSNPYRLVGLKQNACSKYTFDEMLDKLQCRDKLLCKKYEDIRIFIAEVKQRLLAEVDERLQYLTRIVKEFGSSLSMELFVKINSVIIKDIRVLHIEKYQFNRARTHTNVHNRTTPLISKYDKIFTYTQISQGDKCRAKVRRDFLSELEKNALPRTLRLAHNVEKVNISYTNPGISCNEGPDVLQS